MSSETTATANSSPEKVSIFDKLTDPSKYTGSHKQRFDEDGKGKGKEGREDIVDNSGYVSSFKPDTQSKQSKKEPQVSDRLTNPKYYPGSHKHRFDESGKGKGKEGRTEVSPVMDLSEVVARPSSSTTTKSTRSGTSPPKATCSKTVSIPKTPKTTNATSTSTAKTSTPKSTSAKSTDSPTSKPSTPKPQETTTTPVAKKDSQKNIFDRLTDPKQYTGSHKHRFDEDGKGKGKEGRTDITKDTGYVQGFKTSSDN